MLGVKRECKIPSCTLAHPKFTCKFRSRYAIMSVIFGSFRHPLIIQIIYVPMLIISFTRESVYRQQIEPSNSDKAKSLAHALWLYTFSIPFPRHREPISFAGLCVTALRAYHIEWMPLGLPQVEMIGLRYLGMLILRDQTVLCPR